MRQSLLQQRVCCPCPAQFCDKAAGKCVLQSKVIADALGAGYRCFDCAQFYENEDRQA